MLNQNQNAHDHKHLQLWYCADCRSVHMRTGHVSLTFDTQEFAKLSKAVIDIYQNDIPLQAGESDVSGEAPQRRDDVLDSDLIA